MAYEEDTFDEGPMEEQRSNEVDRRKWLAGWFKTHPVKAMVPRYGNDLDCPLTFDFALQVDAILAMMSRLPAQSYSILDSLSPQQLDLFERNKAKPGFQEYAGACVAQLHDKLQRLLPGHLLKGRKEPLAIEGYRIDHDEDLADALKKALALLADALPQKSLSPTIKDVTLPSGKKIYPEILTSAFSRQGVLDHASSLIATKMLTVAARKVTSSTQMHHALLVHLADYFHDQIHERLSSLVCLALNDPSVTAHVHLKEGDMLVMHEEMVATAEAQGTYIILRRVRKDMHSLKAPSGLLETMRLGETLVLHIPDDEKDFFDIHLDCPADLGRISNPEDFVLQILDFSIFEPPLRYKERQAQRYAQEIAGKVREEWVYQPDDAFINFDEVREAHCPWMQQCRALGLSFDGDTITRALVFEGKEFVLDLQTGEARVETGVDYSFRWLMTLPRPWEAGN